MNTPKVSIIIPAYNVEAYIGLCVSSVLAQTMSDLELIVVNDGSSDNTGPVIDELAATDARIKVIHQKNGGVSVARNKGLEHATGEYVCFIDGDDVITKNMLAEMCRMIKESGADICACGLTLFRNKAAVPEYAEPATNATYTSQEALGVLLYEKGILNSPCAKLYKRSVIGKIRFQQDIAFGEDMYFNFSVFGAAKTVTASAFAPYYYLQRRGSAMRSGFNIKRADSLRVAQTMRSEIMERNETALKDAATNKVFTESVSIAGLMPMSLRKSPLFTECMHFIDGHKKLIFNDPHVGKKNKIFSGITLASKMALINLLWARNNIRRRIG